jgi:hypothetical protein
MSDPASPASVAAHDDWPAQAADTIVRVVGQVRDKTTGPAISASRAVVFGLLAAVLGTVLLVVVCILVLRLTVIGVSSVLDASGLERPGRAVWIAYFIDATLIAIIGLVLWRRAAAKTS